MYKVNDYVFYGTVGVCKIDGITELDFGEKGKLYYVIKPVNEKRGTIYALVDSNKVMIRNIISREEAKKLLDNFGEIKEISISDRKMQPAEYKEIEKSADYEKWMGMLKNAYKNKQKKLAEGKKVLTSEEQVFKSAESLFLQELGVSLGVSEDDVRDYIAKKASEVSSVFENVPKKF